MKLKSINPKNNKLIGSWDSHSSDDIANLLSQANKAYLNWMNTDLSFRINCLEEISNLLRERAKEYGALMADEMGKPLVQGLAEIEKCAWVCEYYAEKVKDQLKDEIIETDAQKSYVSYEPLGVILAVMPWNYPFWQVFRFAAPNLMAGNVGVLKHASNVMKSAELIAEVFTEAGFPEGCFQNLIIGSDLVETVLENEWVKAATLTGSKPAGGSVAAIAGKHIKRSVGITGINEGTA